MAFSYKDYEESEAVKKAREEAQKNSQYTASSDVVKAREALANHEANRVQPWTGGTYGQALQDQINKINNRKEFTYDLNADALYQQYKDQYITGGKYAMMDTMGQAAALTGGYGNSYASTAGNQAYQAYLQKLNDVVPDLYRMALDKYNQEGDDLKDMYNIYANQYGTEYGEYRDRVGDWNTEAGRLADQYYNEANRDYSQFADNRDYLTSVYNTERSNDYGQYSDAYNRAFANYQQQVAEQQYWNDYNQREAQYWASYNQKAAQYAASQNTSKKQTQDEIKKNAQDYMKYILDEKWWGTGMAEQDYGKYGGNYKQYAAGKILEGVDSGKLTDAEAEWLMKKYGIE